MPLTNKKITMRPHHSGRFFREKIDDPERQKHPDP
mgnify:CR=1 FL=1